MKRIVPWTLFFLFCIGVGFLHGILPQGLDRSVIFEKKTIRVVSVENVFFPEDLAQKISKKFHVNVELTISKNWKEISAGALTQQTADLLIIPSHWAHSLGKQNLVEIIMQSKQDFWQNISPDFIQDKTSEGDYFVPIYWLRTQLDFPNKLTAQEFFNQNKKEKIYIINDEDHALNILSQWEKLGIKNIIANAIEFVNLDKSGVLKVNEGTAYEGPENTFAKGSETISHKSLLIWGAVIPRNSSNKEISKAILFELIKKETQEKIIKSTPLNSTLLDLSPSVPLYKKPQALRNFKLKDTFLYQYKDPEAKSKIEEKLKTVF